MSVTFPDEIPISKALRLRTLKVPDYLTLWFLIEANRDYLKPFLPWVNNTQCPEDSRYFIQGAILLAKQHREAHWGIFQGDLLCGLIGVHQIDWDKFSATLGYWLSEDKQRQGIMTSVITALLPILHDDFRLKMLEIRVAEENIPSIKVAEKSGFTYMERIENAEKAQDQWPNHLIFRHQN
jgi:Acetyltransferases, including N-acetylases of ribosomal proteins